MKESQLMNITEKIKALDDQVTISRSQRNELNKEAKKLAESRDEFNVKFKKLRDEIRTLKNKRDELNTQVRGLKAKRDQAREIVSRSKTQIKELIEKIRAINSLTPGNYDSTRKEIEKLDWRIQTNPLSQNEENKLISQVRELESQLRVLKKKNEMEKKIREIRDQSKSTEIQANTIHKRLMELAEESETYHKRMIEVVNSATELKQKADTKHQEYVKTKTRGDNVHFEYLAKISMIKELQGEIKGYYEAEHAQKELEIQKKIEDLAENKLKKGKKLTFDEFKLLIDKGAL